MNNIKMTVKWKTAVIKKDVKAAQDALFQTGEALHTEVVQAQVMPFDTGTMQNTATSVQKIDSDHVQLQTVTPYAARMYYHPEYNFQKASNQNAQGRWLDNWINGKKKDWCSKTFKKIFKKLAGI